MAVEFGLLGVIEVRLGGRTVDVGHMRQRCVLAALLVDVGRAVPADTLVDRVWGDRPPQRTKDTLYGYLSRLRQALRPAPEVTVARRPGGYVLDADPLSVDLHLFRDLVGRARAADGGEAVALMRRALGLWRGEPFATVDVPWFDDQRQALLRERLAAELDHIDLRLDAGDHGELLSELAVKAREHPLDERLAGQLMLALYRAGRPSEALAHYQELRHRLAEELGADPGPRLLALHQRVLANDPGLSPPEPAPPAEERSTTPRQLLAPPPYFVGRDAELAVLDKALAAQAGPRATLPVTVVCGIGGVGKTSLALHWAHRRRHRFPDGQLFVDLHGFTPSEEPADPRVVIRGFLDALGAAPGRIPAAFDAQAALYRSLLADRRVLVVLDNARDSAQVLPLLPGTPGCAVLVTSRDQLTGLTAAHQVTHVTVDAFDPATAHELLAGRLGAERVAAEPEAAAELVGQCAGLPLALSVLAGRVTTNPVATLTALSEELRESSRLDALSTGEDATDVRAVLAASYRALDAGTARVFRQLVQAPGPDIGVPAAGSLTGLGPARALQALHRLRTRHLLQEHAPGRFAGHDLLRAYALEAAAGDETEARAARLRVLDHYLRTAWSADRLLLPHRDPIRLPPAADGVRPEEITTHDRAMAWFAREQPALAAAVHLAARHGHDTHAWQLAWAVTTFLTRRGRWSDAAAVHTTALRAATRLGDPVARGESYRVLALERIEAGDHASARHRLDQALALAESSGHALSEAHTRLTLGWLYEHMGDRAAALRQDELAVGLFARLGNRAGLARALNAVAWDHVQAGDHRQAVARCEEALALQDELGDLRGQSDTLDTLGYAYQQLGEHAQALLCHERCLELNRALGHRFNEAEALVHLGEAHQALGDRGAARRCYEQALDVFRDMEVNPARVAQTRALLDALG
ncbi:AfsR/SARP family transcriptional regulator [Streptomyces rubradiris]|uniref:SARP family transcriptional regulator n=1 Tax=Streptomyces rubradiris TaxID=285531 RepID=A0ABQ3RJL5_STRRR|nr:BTAD domain-containing putative transcriptional regulator [Streptomyces rubradiris]GHH08742.1 SARP family transcriptional regulator [Streptomyces rubradiris]GHI56062.1 SARP family transcriptional regulator [Streptomyces rubradiris]